MAKILDQWVLMVENSRKARMWLLIGIIALAAGLRVYKLDEWSLWIDEWFSIDRAIHGSSGQSILTTPFNLLLMRAALSKFGMSIFMARLTPAITGVLSIPLIYWPTRRIFGPRVALVTGVLLAISPWHIFWSQNARFYVLLLLLSTLGYLFLFEGIDRKSSVFLVVGLAFIFLALREKLSAGIMLPFPLLYIVLRRDRGLTRSRRSLLRLLALIVLPLVIFLAFDIASYLTMGTSKILKIIHLFAGNQNTSPARLLAAIIYRIGLPIIILAIFGGVHLVFHAERQRGLYFLLGALVPASLLVSLSLYFFTVDRYVFVTLPFWLILTAVALVKAYDLIGENGRLFVSAVFILVVGVALSEDYLYFTFQQGNRPNWQSAFKIVADRGSSDDLVLTTRPELGQFYLGRKVESINSHQVDDLTALNRTTWFVIDESTGYVQKPIESWIVSNSDLIDIVRVTLPSKRLDIRIYEYRPVHGDCDLNIRPSFKGFFALEYKVPQHLGLPESLARPTGAIQYYPYGLCSPRSPPSAETPIARPPLATGVITS